MHIMYNPGIEATSADLFDLSTITLWQQYLYGRETIGFIIMNALF